jgi:hypothetical protein
MNLEEFATAFTKLRVNTARSSSPHKPCMLLAVLDLAEAGALAKNEIRYLPNLLERYEAYKGRPKRTRTNSRCVKAPRLPMRLRSVSARLRSATWYFKPTTTAAPQPAGG